MGKKVCRFCGKKIDEKYKRCPKCHKYLREDKELYVKSFLYLCWVVVQVIFVSVLFCSKGELLYSGNVGDLVTLSIFAVLLIANSIIVAVKFGKSKKTPGMIFIGCLTVVFSIISVFSFYKISVAFTHKNSHEISFLAEEYSLDVAKKIKNEIDKVFEYDFNDVYSRDIIIGNFYNDGEYSNLYIDDVYGNYRLKFYVKMVDFELKDIYWDFDGHKLYLMKDGEKTEYFEFYYAMSIVDAVLGEDIDNLAKLEDTIEEKVGDTFKVSSNAMYNYEELDYHYSSNTFTVEGDVYNMDYSGGMEEVEFDLSFEARDHVNTKKVWYYGDSSFDYVLWDVKVKKTS